MGSLYGQSSSVYRSRAKKINKKVVQTHKDTIMKLKYLKFAFINILNSIQHYVFSFVFTKCLRRFELDFEKPTIYLRS
ncbi:hypothetical protein NQ317_012991 [Molorchus minor]|uniref:Uncharacterized protein n=1 Tax=Molorchus minor TaxID=1323400 RepID=A0ABQ9JE22_9CUCU|nr:hypothetical protein NQ317_012991 [Molorchus minor]